MPMAKVNGINMFYNRKGKGESLVLIPGLGGDSTHWVMQIPALSRKFEVITLDNRGAGRSDAPDHEYSIDMMADDTIALLDHLRIDTSHILGFSMGGFIAQNIAIRYPERVDRLILAATTCQSKARGAFLFSAIIDLRQSEVSPEVQAKLFMPWVFSNGVFEDKRKANYFLKRVIENPFPQTLDGYKGQVAAILKHDQVRNLSQISSKTLVIGGESDLLIPRDLVEELYNGLKEAELVFVPKVGHCFQIEAPDTLNMLVVEFLSRQK